MGKTQTQPDYPRGITFEQVWAALMENREQQKETDRIVKEAAKQQAERQKEIDRLMKETDRQIKETGRRMEATARQQEETGRQIKETGRRMDEAARQQKETDRQIKEYNKRFGDFTNRFGEVVEYMIAPNLLEKFREAGLNFTQAGPDRFFTDSEHDISFEVDVLLENGDKAMLVEVKTKLTTEHIRGHIKRLGKMRIYADLHGDKRAFLGAVAGVVTTPHAKKYALEQGFFVVEPSGETFNIIPPNGKPKEW